MDDDGLLEGRWTSEYPKGCTKPWEWTGSVPIIEQYYNTGKTVQYGQCWVFSGVLTTCKNDYKIFSSLTIHQILKEVIC